MDVDVDVDFQPMAAGGAHFSPYYAERSQIPRGAELHIPVYACIYLQPRGTRALTPIPTRSQQPQDITRTIAYVRDRAACFLMFPSRHLLPSDHVMTARSPRGART